MTRSLLLSLFLAMGSLTIAQAAATRSSAKRFVVTQPNADFVLPEIVYPDGEGDSGAFDYAELSKTTQVQDHYMQENPALEAVRYLREGIRRMTGKELPVVRRADKSHGIVLTLLSEAPPEIQEDPEIRRALAVAESDLYNANEAFFIRTEPERALIVANRPEGLNHAVAELLESVGYEVLGMGPNWTHVPDFHDKPLTFSLQASGRPGFYIRQLGLSSGQGHGIGTLFQIPLADPADEPVEVSYNRWSIGTRIIGSSMPAFPGHSMQNYHSAVAEKRKELGADEGFLQAPGTEIFFADSKYQVKENGQERSVKLDLSVPFVREIILEDFKKRSEAHFEAKKSDPIEKLFIFGTDSEDGVQPIQFTRHPQWYPEYLEKEGVAFGQPYKLHGFKGLDQPREAWDPESFSDIVFGFNNWLLREYDKWVDSLPPERRLAPDGSSKKDLVRASLYSYNTHDVPPQFNLDPRIRVSIAGFPKHRGRGKWKAFATHIDMAQAFRILLPREPSGDYQIPSQSYHWDFDTSEIRGSRLAGTVHDRIRSIHDAGFRSLHMESDLNFGKMGLEYYLYAKMLWNPGLTVEELESLRERWLRRAYGGGWQQMKEYYDFMAPENFPVNAPNSWAKAIRLIDAAEKHIDPRREPDARRRLDDLKQFWYYYYLRESGQATADSNPLREFIWKGQMSYMTAMHMVTRRYFNTFRAKEIAGEGLANGPAHYTPEETAAWWGKILDFWKVTPVTNFKDAVLAGGKRGGDVDANDLVAVAEFQADPRDVPFFYQSASQDNAEFFTVAVRPEQAIGFRLVWPYKTDDVDYGQKDVSYGISRWDSKKQQWQELVDETMTDVTSHLESDKEGKPLQVAEARFVAPESGTYRIHLGYGGNLAHLFPLGAEETDAKKPGYGFTFFGKRPALSQGPVYLYIPKGIRSLDLEVWGPQNRRTLLLHTGLPTTGLTQTRSVDVGRSGTHVIPLEPGEDGSIAILQSNGFYFPFLYSLPSLWAMSPSQLLVPRSIAASDGLTILE